MEARRHFDVPNQSAPVERRLPQARLCELSELMFRTWCAVIAFLLTTARTSELPSTQMVAGLRERTEAFAGELSGETRFVVFKFMSLRSRGHCASTNEFARGTSIKYAVALEEIMIEL